MGRGLELLTVMVFILFMLAVISFGVWVATGGYRRYRRIKREEDYEDAVADRLNNPQKYENKNG